MHDQSKIRTFTFLRANGWSLTKISKELNVSKTTLWDWDNRHQAEIHFFKHLQLEKLQEKFIPSYEEELAQLRSLLNRIEAALEKKEFGLMSAEFLLQLSLQLRNRLGKMREQVPLRTIPANTPLEPIPLTGCVSRQNAARFHTEFLHGESNADDTPPATTVAAAGNHPAPPSAATPPTAPAPDRDSVIVPLVANQSGNGHTHRNPNPHGNGHHAQPQPLRNHPSSDSFSRNQNRTFPNEKGGGVKMQPLNLNHLQT